MQNAQKNACNLKKFQYNKGEKPNRTSTDVFWKEGELMYKKRFLRLVSAVLALCMMAALLPTAAFAADPLSPGTTFSYPHQGQTLKYTVNEDGKTVSVAEQGWNVVSGDVGIPEMVSYDSKDYAVTDIGESAFEWCRALTKITIPDSVINIKNKAFYDCNKLESVAVSQNSKLTNIGIEAFRGCSSLKTVDLPKSVTAIGDRAFYNCKELASVVIPAGVSNIKIATFLGCTALESITFKEGSILTSIEQNAFYECEKLKSITLPKGLTSIAQSAFYKTALTSIEIPDSVVSIGGDAFCACTNLQRIKIPASTCNVAGNIFTACYKPIAVTYGGAQEQWDNFGVELPEGSTVICTGHTVKFDPNGHGTTPKNVYVENGKTIEKPADPTETGYTFKGWYYTENGVEKEFAFGENGTPVTSSMTLKAKWSPIPYQLTVNSEDRGFHDCDSEVTVDEPTKEGYTFAGWTVETKNVTPQKGDDGRWSFKMPAGNVTLTAKWEINRYTVKFMNGEDEVKSITADYNSTIAVNDAPVASVKEGFVFGGSTVTSSS